MGASLSDMEPEPETDLYVYNVCTFPDLTSLL